MMMPALPRAAPVAVRPLALAKLTPPKLHDVLPRPRLFALLDHALMRPIAWVSAPPGSGKTTLVASYLQARGLRHVWYQADIGDTDRRPSCITCAPRRHRSRAAPRRRCRSILPNWNRTWRASRGAFP
jgi:hypothetical protein